MYFPYETKLVLQKQITLECHETKYTLQKIIIIKIQMCSNNNKCANRHLLLTYTLWNICKLPSIWVGPGLGATIYAHVMWPVINLSKHQHKKTSQSLYR